MSSGVVWKKPEKTYHGQAYSREMPILFIGGMPRSGTTLMRSMMGKIFFILGPTLIPFFDQKDRSQNIFNSLIVNYLFSRKNEVFFVSLSAAIRFRSFSAKVKDVIFFQISSVKILL